MIQPVFVRGLWDRHKTFLIVVAAILVLMVLVNTFFISFGVGDSGVEIGPIETSK